VPHGVLNGRMRINLGCGQSPTPGWANFDNSLTVKLAKTPVSFLLPGRDDYVRCVREHAIRPGNATKIPVGDGVADVLYTSHMLEHLDRREVPAFLAEARRVLKPGGILRIVVPDIRAAVDEYIASGDADHFVDHMHMVYPKPSNTLGKLKFAFLTGFREHQWMYDAKSLAKLLAQAGFENPRHLKPGETTISDPGSLDLREREEGSLYMEAVR